MKCILKIKVLKDDGDKYYLFICKIDGFIGMERCLEWERFSCKRLKVCVRLMCNIMNCTCKLSFFNCRIVKIYFLRVVFL